MHSPKTVAHEIKLFGKNFITIWHVDPETDGTDDSCGWTFPHLADREREYAECLITNEHDNLRHWFESISKYDAVSRISRIFRLHKSMMRPWWRHPRWHFWHWEFQVHLVEQFKRWAFSRCRHCGGRFAWGESPISLTWHRIGPRWFRSETEILHQGCYSEYRRLNRSTSDNVAERKGHGRL